MAEVSAGKREQYPLPESGIGLWRQAIPEFWQSFFYFEKYHHFYLLKSRKRKGGIFSSVQRVHQSYTDPASVVYRRYISRILIPPPLRSTSWGDILISELVAKDGRQRVTYYYTYNILAINLYKCSFKDRWGKEWLARIRVFFPNSFYSKRKLQFLK